MTDDACVPNLDAMTEEELLAFWTKHRTGSEAEALGLSGPGTVTVTVNLAAYAKHKATAMAARLRGDIQHAVLYEGLADRLYERLPAKARW